MTIGKRIMIGLDFTILDRELITYTAFLSSLVLPEKIYFTHVSKTLDIPKQIWKDFPYTSTPKDELLKERMQSLVEKCFPNYQSFDIDFDVLEGPPVKELTHWVSVKNIDLLIVGQKKELKGNGILPQQLTRQIPCNILFVPENSSLQLNQIFVPIDFSEISEFALEQSLELVHDNPDASIYCQHIYYVPKGYYYSAQGEQEMKRLFSHHYASQYNQFVDKFDLNGTDLKPLLTYGKNHDLSTVALDTARNYDTDLMIIGAQGKTWFDRLMVGSFTEKLLQINKEMPMLIIK